MWVFPDDDAKSSKAQHKVIFQTNRGTFVKRDPESGYVRLKRTGKVIAHFI